jgi:hypothetical protein
MNPVTSLHRQAMEFIDRAVASRKSGNAEVAEEERLSAFKLEAAAAEMLRAEMNSEPSRSILYRSAASIALQCGLHYEAEKLIYRGLAGEPPPSIAAELRNLLEDATFMRHLAGGEVLVSQIEFDIVEGVPVKCRRETPEVISLFIPENEYEDDDEGNKFTIG